MKKLILLTFLMLISFSPISFAMDPQEDRPEECPSSSVNKPSFRNSRGTTFYDLSASNRDNLINKHSNSPQFVPRLIRTDSILLQVPVEEERFGRCDEEFMNNFINPTKTEYSSDGVFKKPALPYRKKIQIQQQT